MAAMRAVPAGPVEALPGKRLRRLLDGLARKGACLMPLADAGECRYGLRIDGSERTAAVFTRAEVARARETGWIAPGPCGVRLVLTQAGAARRRRAARPQPARRQPAGKQQRSRQTSPLAWLLNRRDKTGAPLISRAQFDAGERLAQDFWRAQLTPRVTQGWSTPSATRRTRRSAPGAGIDMLDGVVAARERVQRALAVVGPELADILVDVCCLEIGLETAEKQESWPRRAGKVVLDLALTRLARHYGLVAPEQPARSRIRHWGAADFRPGIDAWR